MADQPSFATSTIHHTAIRVADVKAVTTWLTTMFGFRVEREFQTMGLDLVLLSPAGAPSPLVELIGGLPINPERPLPDDLQDILKLPGLHHICLQVEDIDSCMSDLRRHGVKILIDVMPTEVGAWAEKIAFIADPWGNMYELVQLAKT